ncbi:tetratricopeptide repeat protein [Roseateles sp.]|uniref:tetratricopeptide repeat protein n=1 Tax=Roseateles sp. TaxID=1971397 RepID=UPI003BA836A8
MGAPKAAVLDVIFDPRHLLSPLHAQASCKQVSEALLSALPKPPRELSLPLDEANLAVTSHDTQSLVEAAVHLQQQHNAGPSPRRLRFRCGIHAMGDPAKPQSAEIAIARRLAATADLGGLCLSAQAIDQLDQPWRLDLHDRGAREDASGSAIHVFSIEHDMPTQVQPQHSDFGAILAVLPPDLGGNSTRLLAMANLVADTLIVALSRSSQLQVVSARSSRGLRHSRQALADAFEHLQAHHVLQCRGSVGVGDQLFLQLSLHDKQAGHSGPPLWQERLECKLEDLLYGEAFALQEACADVHRLLLHASLSVSKTLVWDSLENYQLFSAATQLMHKLSPGCLEQSGQMLSQLSQKQAQAAEPLAWLAFWHILKGVQGHGTIDEAATQAQAFAQAALDLDPGHALALTLLGHTLSIRGDLQQALAHHQQALQHNPSCALAWSFQALAQTYSNQTREACESARLGLALSPLDPWQYFLEAALAHALLAHQQYSEALLHAQQSLRLCASHAPTLLYLSVAQVRLGQATQAQASMHGLRQIWPDTTVGLFKTRYWGRNTPHAEDFAKALAEAGMPLL